MNRENIDNKYKWDLSLIYKNDEELNKDINKLNNMVEEFILFENHVMDSSKTLYESNKLYNDIARLSNKIYNYAYLKYDEDMGVSKNKILLGKLEKLISEISTKISFYIPEVLSYDYTLVKKYIDENKLLEESRFSFESLFRIKEHILDKDKENMLSSLEEIFNIPSNTFDMIDNVDIKLDSITKNGKKIELNTSNYSIYIKDEDRNVRKQAFNSLYKYYSSFINTISAVYFGNVKKDNYLANVRHYTSALEEELFSDNISVSLYDKLINTVNNNLNLLQKYIELRKEVLNLDEIHMYDLYVPLVKNYEKTWTFEEAKELILKALAPLGETYIKDLNNLFNSNCIDVYYNTNKKSGAYSSGTYDTLPYVLLNYEGNFNDVSTIAHEMGHSMHSYYSNTNNTFEDSSYPIFLAEIASTVNEVLLNKYMYEHSDKKDEKLFFLNNLLETIRTTLYRQTMFAEFEKITHEKEKNNEVLTSEVLNDIYYDLNKKYFSNAIVDDNIKYEWARIPHFYTSFYVYKYATGISVALSIVSDILNNKPHALDNYLLFLKSGGSNYPLEILKKCGIDIVNDDTIEKALQVFDDTLEDFKRSRK